MPHRPLSRHATPLALASAAALLIAAGTGLAGMPAASSTVSGPQQSVFVEPDDGGVTIINAINSARTSVDVVSYDFGGPNVVGQPGAEGALMRAVARGVNVRVIFNSGMVDPNCLGLAADSQAICAWNPKADTAYATQASLEAAAAQPGAGKVRVQFSSQNFQITHQKTIIIDGADKNGKALPTGKLPRTAKALVMTLNLQAYPSLWGQRSVTEYNAITKHKTLTLVNPDYLTNPAGACALAEASAGGHQPCGVEWAARDFGVVVTMPALINRIESVFTSDQRCDGASVTNNLLKTTMPDTWSNGTLQANRLYPNAATGGYQTSATLQKSPQGNDRSRQLGLINHATKQLLVYNEEMQDQQVINALVAAAKRRIDVRVVMAGQVNGYNSWAVGFNQLTAGGVKVYLIDDTKPGSLYVHAKAIISDGRDGFLGSENFGTASMNWNRELGMMITARSHPDQATYPSLPSKQGVTVITNAFWSDMAKAMAQNGSWPVASIVPVPEASYPKSPVLNDFPMACLRPVAGDLFTPALPQRTLPPPAVEQPAS
ncbi:MAG: phospholipase D-like domain-containing protein [Actinobacteria bacterium]|nr:phospholipase D-like domain-containing protein [Actinomycetota bacterium]